MLTSQWYLRRDWGNELKRIRRDRRLCLALPDHLQLLQPRAMVLPRRSPDLLDAK